MVDEDPANDLRCDSEEMCSALTVNHPLLGPPQIGFMNQGRGLQGVVLALAPHVSACQAAQFVIHDGSQLRGGGVITFR